MNKVTINEVAKKAGVSKSTVSKVLNGYSSVSDEVKQKVNKAVQELNYTPNYYAASLTKKDYIKVGLLIRVNHMQNVDGINMQYILGAISRTSQLNIEYTIIFLNTLLKEDTASVVEQLKSRGINGLIFYGTNLNDEKVQGIVNSNQFKCVLVDAEHFNPNTSLVSIDHYKAQYEVANKLIVENNLKKVLYISGAETGYVSFLRKQAMESLKNVEIIYKNGEYDEMKAHDIAERYIDEVDGIICASDLMAMGVATLMKEKKSIKPLSGFDGIHVLIYSDVPILTVFQNFFLISLTAVDEIYSLIKGGKPQSLVMPYRIEKVNV